MRVDVGQRKVPPDVADVTEIPEQLPDGRLGRPQYGHSKSPYSTTRNGSVDRSADVVVLGSTSTYRSTIGSAVAQQARIRVRRAAARWPGRGAT